MNSRKKVKYQPTPQPAPAEPIRKYQLTEIPQQKPNNVVPTHPYTEIFAHVVAPKIENTKAAKQTPTPRPPKSRSMCRYSFSLMELVDP